MANIIERKKVYRMIAKRKNAYPGALAMNRFKLKSFSPNALLSTRYQDSQASGTVMHSVAMSSVRGSNWKKFTSVCCTG